MRKRATKAPADKNKTVKTVVALNLAIQDAYHARTQLMMDDSGGCLQCIEFSIQQLEAAKKLLMK